MAKIMIVEDDVDLVETYTDLLESKHHSVTSVLRAAEAIQVVTRLKPDVIILDLNLPGDSGMMVINFVRRYPPIAHAKIIVATGHPELLERDAYIASKVDIILSKPVSNELLLRTISELPV